MPACSSETACLEGLWSPNLSSSGASASVSVNGVKQRATTNGHVRSSIVTEPRRPRGLLGWLLQLPLLWISTWLWIWKMIFKWLLSHLQTRPSTSRRPCVLLSGGSSVQAVRLARSLSVAGARVIIVEVEGPFALARFSRACARYHTVPCPGPRSGAAEYVRALRDVAQRESVSTFIPVSANSAAYYDSLARAHLEPLGCECWVPGPQEVARLDDPVELMRRTRLAGLPVPEHRLLGGLEEAQSLYESGSLRGRHLAMVAGPAGMRDRGPELRLPAAVNELRRLQERQPGRRWLLLRDPGGEHLVTCTSVRSARLAANVSCRVDETRGTLLAEPRADVDRWIERFLARGWPGARFSAHLCFRFALGPSGELLPMGCRVGIGLAYLGMRPEAHARQLLGLDVASTAPLLPAPACRHALDKREALFAIWDPLPYCVYCCLQLPLRRIVDMIGAQRTRHKPPLAVVE